MSKDYTNIDKALEIAHILKIQPAPKYAGRVILNKELQKQLIKKWKRRGTTTYCGQYTSEFFLKAGYDISVILGTKHYKNINTTGQYANAIKYKIKQVTPEEAFYLACIGRPVLVLSPYSMVVNEKHYNHAAVTWPIFRKKYNENKGPAISQQGWSSLCPGWVSSKAAWGKAIWKKEKYTDKEEIKEKIYYAWQHEMVKYFLPGLK